MTFRWVFISCILLFLLLCIAPLALIYGRSLIGEDGFSAADYIELLQSGRPWTLFARSLYISLATAALGLTAALPLSLALERTGLPWRGFLFGASLVPILIPPHVNAVAWMEITGKKSILAGLIPGIADISLFNVPGAVWVQSLSLYPFCLIVLVSGLRGVDPDREDAALMSKGPVKTLLNITVPSIKMHILSGFLLVFIMSFINYGVPSLLQVKTYPLEVFIQFSTFYDTGKAAAFAFPLILFTMLLLVTAYYALERGGKLTLSLRPGRKKRFETGGYRYPLVSSIIVFLAIAVMLPVLQLVETAGSPAVFVKALKTSWKLLLYSLSYSLLTGLLVASIGAVTVFGFILMRNKLKYMRILMLLPIAVPGALYGIALIYLWNRPGLSLIYGTTAMVPAAFAARFFPFSQSVLFAASEQIPRDMIDAARVGGAGPLKIMTRIAVPLMLPGIIAAAGIVFVLSLGELAGSLLVLPPGFETLSVKIYSLLHYGAHELVSALSVILAVSGLTIAAVMLMVKNIAKRAAL